jgi:hypothetical protein
MFALPSTTFEREPCETHVDHQSNDYETRLEHDNDPPNESNDHETMFGEKTKIH